MCCGWQRVAGWQMGCNRHCTPNAVLHCSHLVRTCCSSCDVYCHTYGPGVLPSILSSNFHTITYSRSTRHTVCSHSPLSPTPTPLLPSTYNYKFDHTHLLPEYSSTSASPVTHAVFSIFARGHKDRKDTKGAKEAARAQFSDKIKRFRPTTPSLRGTVLIDRSELWKGRPMLRLTTGKRGTGGRSRGKIAVRFRGGGHKKLYRFVDFKRSVLDVNGVVQRLEYDPNRTSHIALISYEDGTLSYVLAPQDLVPGSSIIASRTKELEIKAGNSMPLKFIPIGTKIHNIELQIGRGGQLCRSAGTSATLMDKSSRENYALIALQSKEQRFIHLNCMATVGQVSNPLHHLRKLGKAGRSRWLGRKPHVRGVAMNPIDHPHGGGGGKKKGGQPSQSPTGVLAKGGFKTRNPRKTMKFILMRRNGYRIKSKAQLQQAKKGRKEKKKEPAKK